MSCVVTAADGYALRKLQEVEATYPVIMQPTDEVVLSGNTCLSCFPALLGTWERSSQRVADYQAIELIGSGISAGTVAQWLDQRSNWVNKESAVQLMQDAGVSMQPTALLGWVLTDV